MDRKVPPPPQDQVFINFRGDELRNNFISHLVDALQRNKINVFTDKKEQKGEDISNLFKRIEDSKIALAVFSKRYTESRWCLDELVRMKERTDGGKLTVFPIFYNVTTYDVKVLEGEFGIHFRSLMRNKESVQSKIDRWKEALACVSGKIGLTFDDKRLSESDFIGNIVKEILILLQAIPSVQAPNSLANKLPVREDTSSMKKVSKKSSNAQIIGFAGSNSLTPQAIASGHGPTTPIQGGSNTVVQNSHTSGLTSTRPPYNGYPIRYGNRESAGRGETSSMTNNSKKPVKPSKRNIEFNGWPS